MSIQSFSFPAPEIRFFEAAQRVYKFEIRKGENSSDDENHVLDETLLSKELETAVRVVLANLDNLCPFTTPHFIIFPYQSKWEGAFQAPFMKNGVKLSPYPFLITLYVEHREASFRHTGCKDGKPHPTCTTDPVSKILKPNVTLRPGEGAVDTDFSPGECVSPSETDGAEETPCGCQVYEDLDKAEPNERQNQQQCTSDVPQRTSIITRIASSLFSPFFSKNSSA